MRPCSRYVFQQLDSRAQYHGQTDFMKGQTDESIAAVCDLTSEAHLYFFDRYQRLADYHRKRGNAGRAQRLQRKADEHYELGGGDGPPYAAAIGMPPPRNWIATNAVGKSHLKGPYDAA